jgi:hypothetical protein
MLMDEPLTGLDIRSQEDILSILDSLREQRVTVLVALHDLKLAAESFRRSHAAQPPPDWAGCAKSRVFDPQSDLEAYGVHRVSGQTLAGWQWMRPAAAKSTTTMVDFLIEPLRYGFMVRGLIAAGLVGVICAVIGTFIVLRGMAFFGDALAHTILPGVAIGYLVGGGAREPLFWWAMGTALVSAMGIGVISRSTKIKEDTAIGIIFAGMFALGIALISTVRSYTVDLAHFLFGDVLGVTANDLLLIAGIWRPDTCCCCWRFTKSSWWSLRSNSGNHPAASGPAARKPAAGADCHDHCGLAANRWRGIDGGHAGNPGGNCLSADQAAACDDGSGGLVWFNLGYRWAVL